MKMFTILIFLSAVVVSRSDSTPFEPIGNYSQHIPLYSQCGLTTTDIERKDCFQYHKDFFPRIIGARDVRLGDAPWTVGVNRRGGFWLFSWSQSNCAGSLITPKWVLTAAHCLEKDATYSVWLGPEYEGGKWYEAESHHIFPKYNNSSESLVHYGDIGLIKLKDEIELNMEGKYYVNNFLCLPAINMTIRPLQQFALVNGWASTKSSGHSHKMAKISGVWLKLRPWGYRESEIFKLKFIQTDRFLNWDTQICWGDSGAPVWMYHMGRAFQIGVLITAASDKDGCGVPEGATYVPYYMDWIIKMIENN